MICRDVHAFESFDRLVVLGIPLVFVPLMFLVSLLFLVSLALLVPLALIRSAVHEFLE